MPTLVSRGSSSAVWPAYAAGSWASLFILHHMYWAFGGTIGLAGRSMTGTLLLVNLLAIPLLLVATGAAFATIQSWGKMLPPQALSVTVWGVSVVSSVRGIGGLVQRFLLSGHSDGHTLLSTIADPWFVLGGILFGLTASAFTWQPSN
ncbi:DUF3995 domain-containing protein [Halocatena halophila]|uniref:DUF3995 domain-containing protein n=1 Tax=Halocatena halophila TaxID=2814576 RepID=UPI002ED4102B